MTLQPKIDILLSESQSLKTQEEPISGLSFDFVRYHSSWRKQSLLALTSYIRRLFKNIKSPLRINRHSVNSLNVDVKNTKDLITG